MPDAGIYNTALLFAKTRRRNRGPLSCLFTSRLYFAPCLVLNEGSMLSVITQSIATEHT